MDFRTAALPVLLLLLTGGLVRGQEEECTPAPLYLAKHTLLLKVAAVIGIAQKPEEAKGGFTMLAPTDEAIERFLEDAGITFEELMAMPDATKQIREFHSLARPMRLKDFVDGANYQTGLTNSTCGVSHVMAEVDDDGSVILHSTLSHAKVGPDQLACNGIVVHSIDTVLMPCPIGTGKNT